MRWKHSMSCEYPEGCSCGADKLNNLEDKIDRLKNIIKEKDDALSHIYLFSHCIAKAGPLNTKTLEEAWEKFMKISIMATNGISIGKKQK